MSTYLNSMAEFSKSLTLNDIPLGVFTIVFSGANNHDYKPYNREFLYNPLNAKI